MRMKTPSLTIQQSFEPIANASIGLSQMTANFSPKWGEVISRVSQLAKESGILSGDKSQISQLSGLLKLQVDVSRYQLRVELVSKVSESAVASIRKLQQNQ